MSIFFISFLSSQSFAVAGSLFQDLINKSVYNRVSLNTFRPPVYFSIFPEGDRVARFWPEGGGRVARFSVAKRPKTAPKVP